MILPANIEFGKFLAKHKLPPLGTSASSEIFAEGSGRRYMPDGVMFAVYVPEKSTGYYYTARRLPAQGNVWRIMCFDDKTLLPVGQVEVAKDGMNITTSKVSLLSALDNRKEVLPRINNPWRKLAHFQQTASDGNNGVIKISSVLQAIKQHHELIGDVLAERKETDPQLLNFKTACDEIRARSALAGLV